MPILDNQSRARLYLPAFGNFTVVDCHATGAITTSEIERIINIFGKYDSTEDYLSSAIDLLDRAAFSEATLDTLAGHDYPLPGS